MLTYDLVRSIAPTRSGNTIILTMGVMVLAAGVLLVSTQTSEASSKSVQSGNYQGLALAAAEAVAARQETTIATYANAGDPASWVNMNDPKIAGNYGETWLGNVRVQWKIEPAVTASVAATNSTAGWNYIINPAPDTTTAVANPRVVNDATYLFRISAEASFRESTSSSAKVLARAQAVRFASVDKLPLFRYVIFYAKNGQKGDLEFSHGPGVKVQGNVHSNGAIYMGGGTQVNDYTALLRSGSGAVTNAADPLCGEDASATIIGPDINNKSVRMCGVDGIFRLSKQVLFGSFNGFPMSGAAPVGSPANSWYSLTGTALQGEVGSSPNYAMPNLGGSDLAAITLNGRTINPNRVTDVSGMVSRDTASTDTLRKINGVAIRGKSTTATLGTTDASAFDANKANDSRDITRTNYKWESDSLKGSAPGFSGYARSASNGGAAIPVARSMLNRPLEAQAISQPTYKANGSKAYLTDGVTPDTSYPRDNPTTTNIDEEENHWDAVPLFVDSTGKVTAVVSTPAVEKSGSQLQSAIGRGDVYFVRKTTPAFTGWDIKKLDGTAPGTDPKPVGLIIRERPVPDATLAPAVSYPSTISPDYMPYVYGKPRPGLMPFLAVDVADSMSKYTWGTGNEGEPSGGPYDSQLTTEDPLIQSQTYVQGGNFSFSAANRAGPNSATSAGYARRPDFFRENWRLFNLKNVRTTGTAPTLPTYSTAAGLRATYFTTNSFSGPCTVQIDPNVNFNWGGGAPPVTGMPADAFSVRWEGSITAPASGSYTFKSDADDICRIWIDGVRVLHQPSYNRGSLFAGTAIQLEAGKSYSFMAEMVEGDGGANCIIYWSYPTSGGDVIVPSTAFKQPFVGIAASTTNYQQEAFFRLNEFKNVQMRIESFTNASAPNAKVALMIQDALGGSTPFTMSGRSPYAAVCYNPQRGFFIQYRGLPSTEATIASTLHYIGAGTEGGVAAVGGQVIAPTGASTVRSATLTKASDTPGPLMPEQGTQISDNQYISTDYTYTNNPWTTSEGTVDQVVRGPVATTWQKNPQAYYRESRTLTTTWNASTAGFLDSNPDDRTQNIALYTATTGSAQPTPGSIGSGWTLPTATTVSKVDTNRVASNGNNWDNAWVAWGTSTTKTVSFGTSKTIYTPYPKYYNGGTFVRNATGSETLTYMNANFGGGFALATEGDIPTYSAPTTPTINSGYPTITSPIAPTAYAAGTFRFSIPRSVTPVIDVNSYVTRWGPWFTTPQFQWVPYLTGYPNWSQVGVGAVTAPLMKKGNSYRPDSWYVTDWNLAPPPVAPTDGAVAKSLIQSPRWLDDLPTTLPAIPSAANQVWLRIEKVGASSATTVRFLYYVGASTPVTADFIPIKNGAQDVELDLGSFANSVTYSPTTLQPYTVASGDRCVLIGPAIQSGSVSNAAQVAVSNLEINYADTPLSPPDYSVWNASKWEGAATSGANDMTKYLASQYQVFFGSQEITEDFFSFNQANAANRLATEDWIYNTREFWSQSKWWDGNTGRLYSKESTTQDSAQPNFTPSGGVSQRELNAKMTLLTLNMQQVQAYLKTRTIDQAIVKSISTVATPPATGTGSILASRFNRLIYAARTNRYPFNPRLNSLNPWNPDLPNDLDNMKDLGLATNTLVKAMQPYALPYAPAMRSQQFFQGVRLINGSLFDWERPASGTPDFGNSKMSIVTPGQLFVDGDFNYTGGTWPVVKYKGADSTAHPTPVAIMADAISFLSNAFDDRQYKIRSLSVDVGGVTGGGTLAYGSTLTLPAASQTNYYTAIVTNNQPTSKDSVMNGEAASFINVMTYLENWAGVKMNYTGSLVVLDTRRYANSYLLDSGKNYGWGPFGFHLTSSASAAWKTTWSLGSIASYDNPTFALPFVQGAPNRVLTFNYDLLTEQGTPPFTPFGVSVSGRGGWTKVIE